MLHIKSIFNFLFLGLLSIFSFAQIPELNFQKLTNEDGLTESQYNKFVFQDSKGFVWISSTDGLNRFDGNTIKNYRSESGLITRNIQSNFFEDDKNNIWFSTYGHLNCYLRQEDRIQIFTLNDTLGATITQDYLVFHYDTLKKRLWLSAGDQLFGLNINDPNDYFSLPYRTKSKSFTVAYDFKNSLNKIIVGRPDSGIAILYLQDSILVKNQTHLQDIEGVKNPIFLKDSLWLIFNTYTLGVFSEHNPANFRKLASYSDPYFYDILLYDEEHLLISTKGEGLQLYNWRTNKIIEQWKNNPSQSSSLSSNSFKSIHLTNKQFLWASNANQGVNYSFLYHNNFQNPLDTLFNKAEIVSIIEDQQHRIWVATKLKGVFVFSIEGKYLFSYKEPFTSLKTSIWQVLESEDGTIFCSTSKAIYKLDSNNKKNVEKIESINTKLGWMRFMSNIFPNRIFFSSLFGVKEILQKPDKNYYITNCPELAEYQEPSFNQFHQTSQKKLYIPYNDSELWIYKPHYDSLKLIQKLNCNLQFFGFCESKKFPNTIWAGTNQGLIKIINDTTILKVTSENNDLKNEKILGVIEDEVGNLWLTSNQGLWKYDPTDSTKQAYLFQELDGLSSTSFSLYNSFLQASNGDIWLGNDKGLVKFNPNEIKINTPNPKVYIDELLINDTEIKKGIGEENILELPYNKNTLTFDVLAINLIKPEQNKINYRLKGYDDEWLNVENNQRIRYTKIPHGKYNFEVKAVDANGNKSETKNLSIKIKPPFWATWWFCFLIISIMFFVVYMIDRSRVKKLIKEEEKKSQLLKSEMKALRAQMNPHFLFNSMNSINGLIIAKDEKKATEYLTKFSSLLRSILENSEKQKIVLEDEIDALELYIELESLRFTREFNYKIQIDKNIDTSFTRIPPLILQPFVENAIWHGLLPKESGINKLNINILSENDFLILEIEDNGVGRNNGPTTKDKEHKSMGIGITEKRVESLHPENEIRIIDLVDNAENPRGTKVYIKLFAPE